MDKIKSAILKNWKTTLIGIAGGVPTIIHAYSVGGKTEAIMGIAILLIGLLSKDHDTTGIGTTSHK